MWNSSTDNKELRSLLEELYPDVYIASSGVVLLAAQIRNLENGSDILGDRIGPPDCDPVTMLPPMVHQRNIFGTDNYSK